MLVSTLFLRFNDLKWDKRQPCYWHSATCWPIVGPHNCGCLPSTFSREHGCQNSFSATAFSPPCFIQHLPWWFDPDEFLTARPDSDLEQPSRCEAAAAAPLCCGTFYNRNQLFQTITVACAYLEYHCLMGSYCWQLCALRNKNDKSGSTALLRLTSSVGQMRTADSGGGGGWEGEWCSADGCCTWALSTPGDIVVTSHHLRTLCYFTISSQMNDKPLLNVVGFSANAQPHQLCPGLLISP